ncbi:MAG: glycosyltransferase family 4 protein [Acidobacteria bacterium]|nr:glycosyltransferase family 4 protein [Acidobacteriota bacterium]MCB9398736.1 glycosyltransferase family 4 protein [Acidobacteriota bacterium]
MLLRCAGGGGSGGSVKRVVHLIDHWGLGGAQRFLSNWLQLDQQNQHHIVSLFAHGAMEWPLATHPRPEFLGTSYTALPRLASRLRVWLRRKPADWVVIHLNGSRWIAHQALTKNQKRIWFEHSCEEPVATAPLLGRLLFRRMRTWAKRVNRLAAPSLFACQFAQDQFGFKPAQSFALTMPLVWDSEIPLRNAQPKVGFVGRIAAQKGWQDFVKLALKLHQTRPDLTFVVYGSGPDEKAMRREVSRLELDAVWHWAGSPLLGPNHYAELAVLVMPSRYEPFGLTALEAMSVETPVVGYAVGGLGPLLCEDPHSIAVTPNDGMALLAAVQHVLDRQVDGQRLDVTARNQKFLQECQTLLNQELD